ncbi:MAG: sigma 54-interacting transcriptional regulator, partial [Sphingobacteriales bacterium]|nr:sigma 54-interacting transcriptional regulator [Sphingobacteriales bacterium]
LRVLSQNNQISVLLMGETGVGKEVAAHYLHACSLRKDKPFVAINLSAIPRELMESTLFGHKKGSFTGAEKDQIGLFQEANTGVLFLDEIGDIEQQIQVKLLRFCKTK